MVDDKSEPEDPHPDAEKPSPREAPAPEKDEPPETRRHPSPGVKHEPEPDAENLIPAEDEPGTF